LRWVGASPADARVPVTRSTEDSLSRSPHSFCKVTSAACAKLVCTPTRLATSLAAGVSAREPNPNA